MRSFFSFVPAVLLSFTLAGTVRADFVPGDIFAAVGNGRVNVFTPTGTFIQQLDDRTGVPNTTGMTFDNAGDLYVTNFSLGSISKFDVHGNLLNTNWASGLTNTPESIVFNRANTAAYVGGAHAGSIVALDTSGKVTSTISPGGDWVDLAADQHTLLYTPESTRVGSVDINGTANADFSTSVPTVADHALRILETGDVLVADTDRVVEIPVGMS